MEIKYFKLVVAIAEAGNITKATEKLFVTQSALSHQLKEIESQLGSKLFNRVNNKLLFTSVGEVFLSYSRKILHEVEALENEIKKQTRGESGIIRLITESATSYHWLPKILKSFQKKFPNINIQIASGPVNNPIKLLLAGKTEIAIMHRKVVDKNVRYTELLNDEVVALISTGDGLSRKSFLTPSDFSGVNYLTHSKIFGESAFFESFLRPHGIQPKKITYFQHTEAIISMVEEGIGIAVMSGWQARPYLIPGTIKALRISKKGLRRKWFVASLKNEQPKYLNQFLQDLVIGLSAK